MSTPELLLLILRYQDLVENQIIRNRVTLKRWMQRKDDPFPSPIRLGENTIGWRAIEVFNWLERQQGTAPEPADESKAGALPSQLEAWVRSRARKSRKTA